MTEINTGGELSRIVPARRKAIKLNWCKRDFMTFGFIRSVREKRGMKVQGSCFWCRTAFKDEDMLALAQVENSGNKLLCQSCASESSS